MGSEFTEEDWKFVQNRAHTVKEQLRTKGERVDKLVPGFFEHLPPVPKDQISEFERQAGYKLPSDFVDLVTKFTGGWKFYWSLCVKHDPWQWLNPPVYVGDFGGNSEVPFIGATPSTRLIDLYKELQEDLSKHYDRPAEQRAIDPALFPLHLFDGGGGDFTVLRLDRDPVEIYYLDHEYEHWVREEDLMGRGFREYLLAWAELGFIQGEYRSSWVNPETRQPDTTSPKAKAWLAWLAKPNAKDLK